VGNEPSAVPGSTVAATVGGYREAGDDPREIRRAPERARESGTSALINVRVGLDACAPSTLNRAMDT
jgi:hypothetical protein